MEVIDKMTSNCTCCRKPQNIIYWDWTPGTSIKLCYSCLKFLGWDTELKEIMPQLHKCPECNKRYLSKKINPIKCGICWGKYFNNPVKKPHAEPINHHITAQTQVMAHV